jgi:putative ABC transport system permease protein
MLALDRVDFSTVAWFRPDFADEPLGALMNRLALAPENVLVTREFLQALTLRIGDQFNMSVRLADGIAYTGAFRVAGIYRYFPTVQNDEAVVIGNLDHLYTQSGAEFEHFIWLRTQANADVKALFQEVKLTGVEPTLSRDARATIATDQAKMERVGIFGTLSVGFLAATVMAMLALLVHNYASLQERLYQFGVMRAIGLWRGQVIVQVVLEYGMLTIYGAVIGSLIGLYTAEFFAPFFRIPEGAGAPLPPLLPIIAEDATMTLGLIFAGLMILSELLVMTRALTMRIFTTLRMGHQG